MRPDVSILCAMRAEAAPIVDRLGLEPCDPPWDGRLPVRAWASVDGRVSLAINGVDPRTGVDLIGTNPATLAACTVSSAWEPGAILVAGAAGGRSGRTEIGRVHLVDRAFYHDRRIPLPGFDAYGVGPEPLHHPAALADAFGAGVATISTGNALDTLAEELAFFDRNRVTLKDMETAAVAWAASHTGTPVLALRAVTDYFDRPTPEHQFLANFGRAVANLAAAVERGMPAMLAWAGSKRGGDGRAGAVRPEIEGVG